MPAVLPNNVLVCDLVVRTTKDDRKNRFYYEVGPGVINSTNAIVACCNTVFNTFAGPVAAILSPQCSVSQVIGKYISAGNEWEGVSSTIGVAGTLTDISNNHDAMPDDVVAMFKIVTGKHGRDKRGRRFISGVAEKLFQFGLVHADHEAKMIAIATIIPQTIQASYNNEPITLSARHWSRKTGQVLPITKAFAMRPAMSRMDRRKPVDVLPVAISPDGGDGG